MNNDEMSTLRGSVDEHLKMFEQLSVVAKKTGKSEDLSNLLMLLNAVISALTDVYKTLDKDLSRFITKN